MVTDNIIKLASDLEKQELEAVKGVASAQLYSQLLAIYLYQNDLCSAKHLWKRIPKSLETSNPELAAIWSVAQKMWKRDLAATYETLARGTWSEPVAEIMHSIEEKVRERATALISQAYSSLSVDTMASMTGLSNDRVLQLCQTKGWAVQEGGTMVTPTKPAPPPSPLTSSEDQLFKLTEFVSFLEN